MKYYWKNNMLFLKKLNGESKQDMRQNRVIEGSGQVLVV